MSTLKVNKIENTATSNGGVEIDNTGHVKIDNLQMPTAGNLSNRNLIINGAMNVAQRGTSSTGQGYQTVDRFRNVTTTLTATQSQQSLSSGDPFDEGFRFFYRQENTSTSTAAGARISIYQRIENQNISQSGWKYTDPNSFLTLSFWARASVAQTYCAQITTQDTSGRNYPMTFALSADTWTKVTKKIPGNSNLSFTTGNDIGLALFFVPFFGTDRTDSGVSVDTWAAYANGTQLPDMTSTWANTSGATFDITGVQLEVGEMATPFEHRSYGDEMARCQRYYEQHKQNGSQFQTCGQGSVLGTKFYTTIFYRVEKRAVPSVAVSSGAKFEVGLPSSKTNVSADEFYDPGTAACRMRIELVSGTTNGQAGQCAFDGNQCSNASINIDAEL